MDYRDEVFIAVAENLNFSKAAEELFISQPAVTKHIKELESKLNTALFERKGNKVYLTKSGKLMYSSLKQIKQQYRDLEYELGRLNEAFNGSLRIGASSTISQYLIPSVIASFHKRYPRIKFDLFNGNSFEMEQKLLDNEIDLALVENETSNSNINYMDFLDDEIIAVTGTQSVYAKRKNIKLSDIQEIPLVLREKGSGTLQVIQKTLAKQNINFEKLNILIHLGSTEAIKNFLCDFDGIALISEKSITKEIQLKSLCKLNVSELHIHRKLRLATRQGPELKIPGLFIDFLLHYNF
ncbi:LysR substrate-binding domain-containing protein [Labilibaculum sp.]|uniref:LysR substrate-binding domain-containing protein n=1 Tax=Labilibaculum sp. TaxID=2060723 RepID=UPI002AA62CAF|nr:LysR substrate-binding domain-containing protein [Labilibaculum sp.]MBN2597197.1 LysR family transcriptional regulator [Marinifilaceae bacterium]